MSIFRLLIILPSKLSPFPHLTEPCVGTAVFQEITALFIPVFIFISKIVPTVTTGTDAGPSGPPVTLQSDEQEETDSPFNNSQTLL